MCSLLCVCTLDGLNAHTAVNTHTHTEQRGAVGGSMSCSRAPQSWYWRWSERFTFTPPTGPRLEPLGHDFPSTYTVWTKVLTFYSLEQKKALSKLWQQRWKKFMYLKIVFPSLLQVLEGSKMTVPIWYICTICTTHWCLAHGLHLKSHQRCSAGISQLFSSQT